MAIMPNGLTTLEYICYTLQQCGYHQTVAFSEVTCPLFVEPVY